LIDTSIESISSGLFTSAIASLKNTLDSMPNPEGTHIGIITVDNNVNCFEVKESKIAVYTCLDDKESFAPVPSS